MDSKSECLKCGNNTWEAYLDHIENIKTQMALVRCKSCKSAIGVVDITTSERIRKIFEAMKLR